MFFPSAEQQVEANTEPVETYGDEYVGAGGCGMAQGKEQSMRSETGGGEGEITAQNLLSTSWQLVSSRPQYGLLPLVVGLVKQPALRFSSLLRWPSSPRFLRRLLLPGGLRDTEAGYRVLAGFPSVVIGFFALVVLATMMQDLFGYQYRLNAFVGGVAMSLAVIPIIYTVAEDALSVSSAPYEGGESGIGSDCLANRFFRDVACGDSGSVCRDCAWFRQSVRRDDDRSYGDRQCIIAFLQSF